VLIFDQPEVIDNPTVFIVGHLFHVQMGAVDDIQPRIAVVGAAERRPSWRFRYERVFLFPATLCPIRFKKEKSNFSSSSSESIDYYRRSCRYVNGRLGIVIRIVASCVVNSLVEQRPGSLVGVLVRPDG